MQCFGQTMQKHEAGFVVVEEEEEVFFLFLFLGFLSQESRGEGVSHVLPVFLSWFWILVMKTNLT